MKGRRKVEERVVSVAEVKVSLHQSSKTKKFTQVGSTPTFNEYTFVFIRNLAKALVSKVS